MRAEIPKGLLPPQHNPRHHDAQLPGGLLSAHREAEILLPQVVEQHELASTTRPLKGHIHTSDAKKYAVKVVP